TSQSYEWYTVYMLFIQIRETQREKHSYPTRRSSDLEKTNHTLEDEEAKKRLGARLLPTIEALENKKWDDSFSFYTYYLYENQSRSEEHTSEPSHVSISYAVFCLKKQNNKTKSTSNKL